MAVIALHSAASGLSALSTQLDVISNNLANINTTAFKASRANFQDLFYIERKQPGVENLNGDASPIGLYVGLGTEISGTQKNFEQGARIDTGKPLDLMIEGMGFFQVEVEDDLGENGTAYTRAGNFTLNAEGQLVLASDNGRVLKPEISVGEGTLHDQITIGPDGRVLVREPGTGDVQEVGRIELATFINPAGLKEIGENLYVVTPASGDALTGGPGEGNFGRIQQASLEASNVEPVRELIDLIKTQRAFELNSQTIRAADDVLQQITSLKRR